MFNLSHIMVASVDMKPPSWSPSRLSGGHQSRTHRKMNDLMRTGAVLSKTSSPVFHRVHSSTQSWNVQSHKKKVGLQYFIKPCREKRLNERSMKFWKVSSAPWARQSYFNSSAFNFSEVVRPVIVLSSGGRACHILSCSPWRSRSRSFGLARMSCCGSSFKSRDGLWTFMAFLLFNLGPSSSGRGAKAFSLVSSFQPVLSCWNDCAT